MQDIKTRIEKLRQTINHHRYLYHVLDRQEISDAALDSLKHELAELEKQYPQYASSDSPTQRIGGKPLDKFVKVVHKARQRAFRDAFSREEIKKRKKIGLMIFRFAKFFNASFNVLRA